MEFIQDATNFVFIAITVGSVLKLHPYNQINSMTHCEEGLIVGKDFAIFKAEVDLGNSSQVAGKTVKFEATIDGGSIFHHLCLVNLEERCFLYGKGHCFCQREEESKVYHIIINISATHRYSNSLIRGHLTHAQGSGQGVNTVRRFPRMYNITNVTFLVNRTHLLGETTLLYDNNIKFCCPDSPRPCTAILVSGQQTISSNERCLSADLSSLNVLENVSFIYDFCKGEKVRKIITVRKQQTDKPVSNLILNPYTRQVINTTVSDKRKHNIIFKAEAYIVGWTRGAVQFHFYLLKKGEKMFTNLCNVSLTNGCVPSPQDVCYCNHTDSTNTHHIVVNLTADLGYSDAQIQARLVSDSSATIYSQVQHFPTIYSDLDHDMVSPHLLVTVVTVPGAVLLLSVLICCVIAIYKKKVVKVRLSSKQRRRNLKDEKDEIRATVTESTEYPFHDCSLYEYIDDCNDGTRTKIGRNSQHDLMVSFGNTREVTDKGGKSRVVLSYDLSGAASLRRSQHRMCDVAVAGDGYLAPAGKPEVDVQSDGYVTPFGKPGIAVVGDGYITPI